MVVLTLNFLLCSVKILTMQSFFLWRSSADKTGNILKLLKDRNKLCMQ